MDAAIGLVSRRGSPFPRFEINLIVQKTGILTVCALRFFQKAETPRPEASPVLHRHAERDRTVHGSTLFCGGSVPESISLRYAAFLASGVTARVPFALVARLPFGFPTTRAEK